MPHCRQTHTAAPPLATLEKTARSRWSTSCMFPRNQTARRGSQTQGVDRGGRGEAFRRRIRIEELAGKKSRARMPQERRSARGRTPKPPGFECLILDKQGFDSPDSRVEASMLDLPRLSMDRGQRGWCRRRRVDGRIRATR